MTDFDQTLTRFKLPDGNSADSVFKTIIKYQRTPKEIQELTTLLFNKYYPLEQNPHLSIDEKLLHLDEWWNKDLAAFVTAKVNKPDFAHMTLTSKLIFRKGTGALIKVCKEIELPIVVLSGGIHELIDAALKILKVEDTQLDFDHLKIISNRFTYKDSIDDLTSISGFITPVVHPASK